MTHDSSDRIRIGSRGSALALWQARHVESLLLQIDPALSITIHTIKTTGDKILDVPLAKVGGKALFVKEIEEALQEGTIDLAVHSLKDVPTRLPGGLCIGAILPREDPRDAWISAEGRRLEEVAAGTSIGTSSLRRQAQLYHYRSDLKIMPLRGNLDTRVNRFREKGLGGVVVAAAGLRRMGWTDRITSLIDTDISLPAVGQGAIAIECRSNDTRIRDMVKAVDDPDTADCVRAERALLDRLGGGCQVPIAGYASMTSEFRIRLRALVASPDGRRVIRADPEERERTDPEGLGASVAEALLRSGAKAILEEILK
jgi:hydroxymethylbilane synthase